MWYRGNRYVIAGLEEILGTFAAQGISDAILDRIRTAPPEYKGHFINQLKQNPLATEADLMTGVGSAIAAQQPKAIPPTAFELQTAQMFPEEFQQWALVQLRKLRYRQPLENVFAYRGFDDGSEDLSNQYFNIQREFQQIADWAKATYRDNPYFQLAAYDFSQALSLTKDWHDMMAGLGAGSQYAPYLRDEDGKIIDERVVYIYPDGWHISQLFTENDLKTEGNKMNHCVGSYCSEVERGETRIFSLRDPRNHPVATVEMDGENNVIKQIKAHSDARPEREIRQRLATWFGTIEEARWPGANANDWEPYWDYDPESLRGAIYDTAYGKDYDDDEDARSNAPDFHYDYDVPVEPTDYSRDISKLDVPDLLENVEMYAYGDNGAMNRIQTTKYYTEEEEIYEPLGSVISEHDSAVLKQFAESQYKHPYEDIMNALGVFDVAEKYHEQYESQVENFALNPHERHDEELAEESNEFRLYYYTLKSILDKIVGDKSGTEALYHQLTGRSLGADIAAKANGGLVTRYDRYLNERAQPPLLKHKDDFLPRHLPYKEDGTPDESVFDDGGWKYAKRKVDWYRFVQS